jgi:hypothetical protein
VRPTWRLSEKQTQSNRLSACTAAQINNTANKLLAAILRRAYGANQENKEKETLVPKVVKIWEVIGTTEEGETWQKNFGRYPR